MISLVKRLELVRCSLPEYKRVWLQLAKTNFSSASR